MSQFEEMRSFVRIVEAGSISRAAEQLGVAKSGVSRRLGDLEKRLGVKLLNRTTRRSSLTEAGQSYYSGAAKLLTDVAELNAATADTDASLEGTLRLAVPLSFGLRHLSPAIDEFLKTHPDLNVNIDFSDRLVDLVESGVDLAIRISRLGDSSLRARKICPIRMLLCASPAYIEKQGCPKQPEDLKQHRLLRYDMGSTTQVRLEDHQGKVYLAQTVSRVAANNGDFLCDMAMAGHGIIVTPSFIAWQALASGDLVEVMPGFAPPPLDAWAVYPQTRYLSRRARLFIDFLAERFGDNPYWDQYR